MAVVYNFYNGPFPTTTKIAAVATGTSIKTLLQVKSVTGIRSKVVAWGISFDGSSASTPVYVDLIETGTVFATVTAAVAADLAAFDDPNAPTSTTYFSVGTSATGYTSSSEGSITATRVFDAQLVSPTNQYVLQFPLGREPQVNAASALRIRVHAPVTVNAICWVSLEV